MPLSMMMVWRPKYAPMAYRIGLAFAFAFAFASMLEMSAVELSLSLSFEDWAWALVMASTAYLMARGGSTFNTFPTVMEKRAVRAHTECFQSAGRM